MISSLSLTPLHQKFPNWDYERSNQSFQTVLNQPCSSSSATKYPSYIEYLDRIKELIDIKANNKIKVIESKDKTKPFTFSIDKHVQE